MTDRTRLVEARRLVERSCCVCRTRRSKKALIRLTRTSSGEVALDTEGTLPGRGSYLCPSVECIEIGLTRGRLARSLRAHLPPETRAVLMNEMLGYLEGRAWPA